MRVPSCTSATDSSPIASSGGTSSSGAESTPMHSWPLFVTSCRTSTRTSRWPGCRPSTASSRGRSLPSGSTRLCRPGPGPGLRGHLRRRLVDRQRATPRDWDSPRPRGHPARRAPPVHGAGAEADVAGRPVGPARGPRDRSGPRRPSLRGAAGRPRDAARGGRPRDPRGPRRCLRSVATGRGRRPARFPSRGVASGEPLEGVLLSRPSAG